MVDLQANAFTQSLKAFIESYQGSNIAVTMGEDFQFQAAQVNFKNMDALIRWVCLVVVEGFEVMESINSCSNQLSGSICKEHKNILHRWTICEHYLKAYKFFYAKSYIVSVNIVWKVVN